MFSHPNPEAYASDASHIRVFVGEREASCLTFYSFTSLLLLILLLCLLFLCAEKSNKRWNFNVFAYTFTLVPLSSRTSAFQNPSKPLESLGFCTFFKLE